MNGKAEKYNKVIISNNCWNVSEGRLKARKTGNKEGIKGKTDRKKHARQVQAFYF